MKGKDGKLLHVDDAHRALARALVTPAQAPWLPEKVVPDSMRCTCRPDCEQRMAQPHPDAMDGHATSATSQNGQSVKAARLDGGLALLLSLKDNPTATGTIQGDTAAALWENREEFLTLLRELAKERSTVSRQWLRERAQRLVGDSP